MKSVLVVVAVLALAHHAFAQSCPAVQNYTTTLKPACTGRDVYVLWPNYENMTSYWQCFGAGNPVLVACPQSTWFCYFQQVCTDCENTLRAPACPELKTENTPVCVPIESSTTLAPTTASPSTTPSTTKAPTTAKPTTAKPTVTTASTTPKTTTLQTTTVSNVPAPPSPATSATNIPTPPTPAPTPPSVNVTPPSQPEGTLS